MFPNKESCLERVFHKPVWWDKQCVSEVSLSQSAWLHILVFCACYVELDESGKTWTFSNPLTSFTVKCKKHNREHAADQMDTLQLKTFLKEKDPGSFHLLTARADSVVSVSTWLLCTVTVGNCHQQHISRSYLLNFLDLKNNFQFQIRFSLVNLAVKTFSANIKKTLLLRAELRKKKEVTHYFTKKDKHYLYCEVPAELKFDVSWSNEMV